LTDPVPLYARRGSRRDDLGPQAHLIAAREAPSPTRSVPRLSFTKSEAAEALGMSISHFERHLPLHVVLRPQRLVAALPIAALDRWLEAQARRLPPAA
jgi:hypothetical protein